MNGLPLSEHLQNGIECVVLLPVRMRHRRRARAKREARIDALGAVRHTL